eukprot:CAMPEP_0204079082 /NCGR_PEP_ID=MMETSP0360-20130528/171901_1 /ASSEMBLY_ACC=CAM_ASM_000342 /TAXON_ID=268821 /ORGANISM="Scrippsiella Hangoei, Strain SHTV-5" /LENGTH=36 /DNA_ID= /DNA_START= /DNA_END= /DNA_ORIENTATION=
MARPVVDHMHGNRTAPGDRHTPVPRAGPLVIHAEFA